VHAGEYELLGFASHMGSNLACGHYVAHIKQPDGRWVLFNDQKVREGCESEGERGRARERWSEREGKGERERSWYSMREPPRPPWREAARGTLRDGRQLLKQRPTCARVYWCAQVALSEATPLDLGYVYLYRRL
jgi:hypothetical protein